MLEHDGALLTWALVSLPQPWAEALGLPTRSSDEVEATGLPDHRIAYLEYEGAVSGGRGTVKRLAEGTFEWIERRETKLAWRFESGLLTGKATMSDGSAAIRLRVFATPEQAS